jgi:hypothetical protein
MTPGNRMPGGRTPTAFVQRMRQDRPSPVPRQPARAPRREARDRRQPGQRCWFLLHDAPALDNPVARSLAGLVPVVNPDCAAAVVVAAPVSGAARRSQCTSTVRRPPRLRLAQAQLHQSVRWQDRAPAFTSEGAQPVPRTATPQPWAPVPPAPDSCEHNPTSRSSSHRAGEGDRRIHAARRTTRAAGPA